MAVCDGVEHGVCFGAAKQMMCSEKLLWWNESSIKSCDQIDCVRYCSDADLMFALINIQIYL